MRLGADPSFFQFDDTSQTGFLATIIALLDDAVTMQAGLRLLESLIQSVCIRSTANESKLAETLSQTCIKRILRFVKAQLAQPHTPVDLGDLALVLGFVARSSVTVSSSRA